MKIKNSTEKAILVTGSAGFIGFHLCSRLLKQGCSVVGIDNLNDYYDVSLKHKRLDLLSTHPEFVFHKEDIADRSLVNRIFECYSPDIVVNLAAQAGVRYSIDHPETYIQSNLIGFFNLLEACRSYPVQHFVYASSSSVYGANRKVPFSEQDQVDKPVSLYAATKKSNELMAYTYSHLYGIAATGLRFFTVYGPWGRPDMAYFSFTKAIEKGTPIRLFNNGDLYRDFTYVDDIVEGINRLLCSPPKADENGTRHKVYNIGNNHPVKLMEFVETLEQCLGKTAVKEYYPMQPGDVYRTYADISELERDFGFRPETKIKDGLGKFAEWYRELEHGL